MSRKYQVPVEPPGLTPEESCEFWQQVIDDNLEAARRRRTAGKPKAPFDVVHRIDVPDLVLSWENAHELVQEKLAAGIARIRHDAAAGGGELVESSVTIREVVGGFASVRSYYIEATAMMPEDYPGDYSTTAVGSGA